MILVTRLDGSELYVNSELIEFLESTPDTVLSLTDGRKLVVKETPEEIVRRVIAFKRQVLGRSFLQA